MPTACAGPCTAPGRSCARPLASSPRSRPSTKTDEDKRTLVRGARYRGRARLLRRMEAGVIRSLEVDDASLTSAALMTLQRWMERIAEKEVARLTATCEHYEQANQLIAPWVQRGMDERFRRVQQVEARIQMLLGIVAAQEVLPLEFTPAHNVADLLVQYTSTNSSRKSVHGPPHRRLAQALPLVLRPPGAVLGAPWHLEPLGAARAGAPLARGRSRAGGPESACARVSPSRALARRPV